MTDNFLYQESGYPFHIYRDILKDIIEKLSYIAEDFEEELKNYWHCVETNYELPDGQVITIGDERFRAPEPLFQPSLIGIESDGIDKLLYESIMKCALDLQIEMYENIVLSGGSCNLPGMAMRIKKEIKALTASSIKPKVIDYPNKQNLSWIGASIMASQPSFYSLLISASQYQEYGVSIVHRKCF